MATQNYTAMALGELAAVRQNAAADQDKRREAALAALPQLTELENRILQLGIAGAMSGAVPNALFQLEEEKAALLKSAGFPPDQLERRYRCALCKDTGRLDGRLCSCIGSRVRELRRRDILRSSPLSISSFDTFQLDYYPTTPDANGVQPRSHMAAVLEYCHQYADHFDRTQPSLLLLGRAGLGKTHLALAIAGRALEKGFDVLYVSAQDAFSRIETANFSNNGDPGFAEALRTADLLVLDDLGTEFLSPYILSELYRLINTRILSRLPTIYTTNLAGEGALTARYTEKISSRLLGSCELLHFFGADIRKLQKG